MKTIKVDNEKNKLYVSFDFWEIEELGYDVIEQKERIPGYYKRVISILKGVVIKEFGDKFEFGIKTIINKSEGEVVFEISPINDRINEFVLEEMLRNNSFVTWFYPDGI